MPLTDQYLTEGENGFLGVQSRNNPLELQAGFIQSGQNIRLDRGTASVRKGLKRLTSGGLIGNDIFGSGVFSKPDGTEYILLATGTALYTYNTSTLSVSSAINYPAGRTITATDKVDIVQANNVAYILRGQGATEKNVTSLTFAAGTVFVNLPNHGYATGDEIIIGGATQTDYNGSFIITVLGADDFTYAIATTPVTPATGLPTAQRAKAALVWDGNASITVVPQGANAPGAYNMPPSDFGIYFKNRLVVKQSRDTIAASDYLDYNTWDLDFAQFVINLGANDFIVGFQPWQEDRFIIFQRNSIYYAYIDPNGYVAGSPPGGNSFVQSLTAEFGCSARRSIVNAGEFIFFLSDNGVYLLNPSLDLKLLGNTTPLSDPISDIISRINTAAVSNAVGRVHNNRYYLAVPLDGSTRNNAVLVYSLLNKAWESVDTFPTGMYVDAMQVATYGQAKRLYFVNKENGILLTEELNHDEFDNLSGTPVLPFVLPAEMTASFAVYPIRGSFRTRRYFYNTYSGKRFSAGEMDIACNAGDSLRVTAITNNPDSESPVLEFASSTTEDYTKRFRIAKKGFGLDLLVESITGRPTVRGLRIAATIPGRVTISED
jgi:hypothetical protein